MRSAIVLGSLLMSSTAFGYGEVDADGLPNHRERLLHVLTNQVRQAPHDWPGWNTALATPDARGPVALESGLVAAARFHAVDMAQHGCFQHESCDGTETFDRISRYFRGPAGENIYTATGDSTARSAITGWMNSDGHRVNILTGEWTWLGTGFAGSGRQVYYVQDFGGGSVEMPNIPGAAYEDRGTEYNLIANYFDADRRAPESMVAMLDGARVAMTRVAGKNGNETLQATVPAVDGCVGLSFVAVGADQSRAVFPTTGELLVGAACTAEFSAERVEPKPDDTTYLDANDRETGCRCVAPKNDPAASLGLAFVMIVALGWRRRR